MFDKFISSVLVGHFDFSALLFIQYYILHRYTYNLHNLCFTQNLVIFTATYTMKVITGVILFLLNYYNNLKDKAFL